MNAINLSIPVLGLFGLGLQNFNCVGAEKLPVQM